MNYYNAMMDRAWLQFRLNNSSWLYEEDELITAKIAFKCGYNAGKIDADDNWESIS